MVTSLAISTPNFMAPQVWQMMTQQAETLVKSGFLPKDVNTPQKAIAIIMAGYELGIQPWQALSTINVIQGKPTISPQLMLALIQRSGQLEDITIDGNDQQCIVTLKRKGQVAHAETFTMADAKKMNLAGKTNWTQQPATMLKWRAVAACARIVFPDVILGLYTPDEMGDDDGPEAPEIRIVKDGQETDIATGEIVEAAEVVEEAPAPEPTTEAPVETSAPPDPNADKPGALFQYLMKNVTHPHYARNEHKANTIKMLMVADMLYEAISRKRAITRMNSYADYRDAGMSENDAMNALRKLAGTPAGGG